MKKFFVVILFLVINKITNAQFFNVKDFGAIGNGIANDYNAIQNAIAALNTSHTGTLFFPSGTYKVDEILIDNGGYGPSPHTIGSNFNINNCHNVSIIGCDATISIKGNFHRGHDYYDAAYSIYRSFKHQVSFVFSKSKDIYIYGLTIDGNVHQTTEDLNVAEGSGFGFKFGKSTADTINNVVIKNCNIKRMLADGLTWVANGGNLKMENVNCTNNSRLGLSIVNGKDFDFYNCTFNETGINIGQYPYHAPASGVDIENESFNDIENIKFNKCSFNNNKNFQFIAQDFSGVVGNSGAGHTRNVTIESSQFIENRATVYLPERTVLFTVENGLLKNSFIKGTLNFTAGGYWPNSQQAGGVIVRNCTIKSDGWGIKSFSPHKVRIENCDFEQGLLGYTDPQYDFFPYISDSHTYLYNNKFSFRHERFIPQQANSPYDIKSFVQGNSSSSGNIFNLLDCNIGTDCLDGCSRYYFLTTNDSHFCQNNTLPTNKLIRIKANWSPSFLGDCGTSFSGCPGYKGIKNDNSSISGIDINDFNNNLFVNNKTGKKITGIQIYSIDGKLLTSQKFDGAQTMIKMNIMNIKVLKVIKINFSDNSFETKTIL